MRFVIGVAIVIWLSIAGLLLVLGWEFSLVNAALMGWGAGDLAGRIGVFIIKRWGI